MDVLGLPLTEAQSRLRQAGQESWVERPTAPPARGWAEGVVRVVQQRATPDGGLLLVTSVFPGLRLSPPGDAQSSR